ncbi:ribonuclease R [Roseomonas sp. NAR14]|uniref:Ribonuclease R n=1 Tax=Roseomonas acroporae TaxID=2937791 RepID=A0A9X2BXP2_9PROT|nr:ribonuclease R [Roseomonas acroporae]
MGKTEISREFGLGHEHRPALRALLRELKDSGELPPSGRPQRDPERLPEVTVLEVFGTDPDGDPLARPLRWEGAGRMPLVYMHPEARGQPALAPGDRVLARLKPIGRDKYEGRTMRRIGSVPARVLGVYEGGRIAPVDRRQKADWVVPPGESGGALPGEIVLAEPLPAAALGPRPARIIERLGPAAGPRAVSIVCVHAHGIPDVFPPEALAEAGEAGPALPAGREDLRDLPLVTIDGEDARDFDDAVFAEAASGDGGEGWRLVVAIADVAHYVRPGSALDREARLRGNSVYFPDRVVPMLPEALSNGWCSLRPGENRACLFAEIRIDGAGRKVGHRFGRGLMRSAARLTYEAAQAASDAGADPEGVPAGRLAALFGAYRALLSAREARGTLDLDLPERRVLLDADGTVLGVEPRARLDSHRLIEEFMVAANVCAAEELERLAQPCLYRVHDRPSDAKLEGLRQFLATFGLSLAPAGELRPGHFARILEQVRGRPEERLVNETVLRAQSQAAYSPDNIGHFGLALARYAHFTSPIRRYADLLVHRALVRGLRLGDGALAAGEEAGFVEAGEHLTRTERRAAQAERDAVDRYLAAFLQDRVGNVFDARISGVTRFGLFVTLDGNGASGIVPLASLPDDKWFHDEAAQSLVGQRTGLRLALGEAVEARLVEAAPLTGGLVFHLMQGVPRRPRGEHRDTQGNSRGNSRRKPPRQS